MSSYKHDFIKLAIKQHPRTREELQLLLRKHIKNHKQSFPKFSSLLKSYRELLSDRQIDKQPWLEHLLIKRAIRTLSGVAPIHVMTAPLGCPGNCLYCPNEPGMPKSYLSTQPGAMRAILNDFDPYKQVTMRLQALYQNGHHPEKIELIENGGTWTALPKRYRTWFMLRCFQAANDFKPDNNEYSTDFAPLDSSHERISQQLKKQGDHLHKKKLRLHENDDSDLLEQLFSLQKINETATYRIIGVTLETRPDWLSDDDIVHMRLMGCTKVEIGVQHIDDDILDANLRGHGKREVIDATQKLRDAGFKVAYHIMPGMYKSTPAKDVEMFKILFNDPGFKPDFLKIYPCIVVEQSRLYKLWKDGKFIPYDGKKLVDILVELSAEIKRYCRVARLVRDIPAQSISGGNKITNLRETVEKNMEKLGIKCQCVRCREIMNQVSNEQIDMNDLTYETVNGTEHFLSLDGKEDDRLYAFLRLRIPQADTDLINTKFPELKKAAIIREVHTYGKLMRITTDQTVAGHAQHKGLGKQLMEKSEIIAKKEGFKKMAVISGIGTREYYRMLGYKLEGTYMVKYL